MFLVDESHKLIDSFVFVLYWVSDGFHFLLDAIELSLSFLGLLVLLVDDSVELFELSDQVVNLESHILVDTLVIGQLTDQCTALSLIRFELVLYCLYVIPKVLYLNWLLCIHLLFTIYWFLLYIDSYYNLILTIIWFTNYKLTFIQIYTKDVYIN